MPPTMCAKTATQCSFIYACITPNMRRWQLSACSFRMVHTSHAKKTTLTFFFSFFFFFFFARVSHLTCEDDKSMPAHYARMSISKAMSPCMSEESHDISKRSLVRMFIWRLYLLYCMFVSYWFRWNASSSKVWTLLAWIERDKNVTRKRLERN